MSDLLDGLVLIGHLLLRALLGLLRLLEFLSFLGEVEEALKLQRPLPNEAMTIVARSERHDG